MNPNAVSLLVLLLMPCAASADEPPAAAMSEGRYRLPYADGTRVKVFDDAKTHRPAGRIDLYAIDGQAPYRVTAAASGKVASIQDSYAEQQSGRAAADCRNNYVWIRHANGEWTGYSHLARGSVSDKAGLKVGDSVAVGQYIGDEDAVGCAMLDHVHFEVAVADTANPIDEGGFLKDNADGRRLRNPRFCGVPDGGVVKDAVYSAAPCDDR